MNNVATSTIVTADHINLSLKFKIFYIFASHHYIYYDIGKILQTQLSSVKIKHQVRGINTQTHNNQIEIQEAFWGFFQELKIKLIN